MQRVHEEREERVDVCGRPKTKTPAERRAVDRVLDVCVERMTETDDVLSESAPERGASFVAYFPTR